MHGKLLSSKTKMLTGPWTAKSYNPLNVKSNTMFIAMNSWPCGREAKKGRLCTVSSGLQPEAMGTKMRQWLWEVAQHGAANGSGLQGCSGVQIQKKCSQVST